ncbi:MAG TPA: hypothetical protein VM120_08365 [Bryobacteraceae bacterium]|nr:hypothetical protein [Bryobacteraceae bacterium]
MHRIAAILWISSLHLVAADIAGIWVGQIPVRNGEFLDVAFKFTQTGTVLGGKQYGDYRSSPITEGRIFGDQITFVVLSAEQNGNQINESRLRFTGVLKDGQLELTRERESSRNAGNGGDSQTKAEAGPKLTLRLKRLI